MRVSPLAWCCTTHGIATTGGTAGAGETSWRETSQDTQLGTADFRDARARRVRKSLLRFSPLPYQRLCWRNRTRGRGLNGEGLLEGAAKGCGASFGRGGGRGKVRHCRQATEGPAEEKAAGSGRVKPDVVAVGLGSDVMGTDGNLRHANGTSFSSPIMCGMVACLWQACPELTAKEIIELVRRSGDRAVFPDNIYGYGIPDLWKAYQSTVNTRR